MSTLYERLVEIALESGGKEGRGLDAFIAKLAKVSPGRVGQIKMRDGQKLGADSVANLVARGWRSEWINHGQLPKRTKDAAPHNAISPEQAEWLSLWQWLMPAERQAVIEQAQKNRAIAETLWRGTNNTPNKRTGTK